MPSPTRLVVCGAVYLRTARAAWPTNARGELVLYRGESVHNRGGHYFSSNRQWAAQFTQTGQLHEVQTFVILPGAVWWSAPLPHATSETEFDAALAAAKQHGKQAFVVDEGTGEPNSMYVFDKTALRRS